MRVVATHSSSIDMRSPLSTHDLKKLVKALSATGCTSFTLAWLKAMFALIFFAFLWNSEVTKGEHNVNMSQCRVTKSMIKLTFCPINTVQAALSNSTFKPQVAAHVPTGC